MASTLKAAPKSLVAAAGAYFKTEVAGQAAGTIEAKRRDLTRFLKFYGELYGHDDPSEWYPSVTREFIKDCAQHRLAPATIARTYASVRHFALWIHKKIAPFPLGSPVDGVKPPSEPEPQWKGLSRRDELRFVNAAQTLRARPGKGTNQGLRDHAMLMVMLGSGLRVSELVGLDVEQYTGNGFGKVLSKGNYVRDFVPLQPDARKVVEEWLAVRGKNAGPLFTTRTGSAPNRKQVYALLRRIADQANAHAKSGERIDVSPHTLRHTCLRKVAEQKGVQYALALSGHRSPRYIWRYVQPHRESLLEAIESIE